MNDCIPRIKSAILANKSQLDANDLTFGDLVSIAKTSMRADVSERLVKAAVHQLCKDGELKKTHAGKYKEYPKAGDLLRTAWRDISNQELGINRLHDGAPA